MNPVDLLTSTPNGLFSPLGGFFIDPLRPVERALITHGHSDHARPGHKAVMATRETLEIMAVRCGEGFAGATEAALLGKRVEVNGVAVTFVPAGHVLGSAQIVVEAGGTRIVVSGDYKRARDPTCASFEVVPCDIFITEATFGLPVFRHPDAESEIRKLLASLRVFPDRAHLVGVYALGKAQRVIALLREAGYDRPIHVHGALERLCALYAAQGVALGEVRKVPAGRSRGADPAFAGEIVLCPPGQIQDLWTRRFPDPVSSFASGWMRVRARARQRGVELPLVISDHCDWDGLTETIRETGAGEVWVTHGEEDALVHWCGTLGIRARPLHLVGYGEEEELASLPEKAAAEPPSPEEGLPTK
ncbi:MAG: ligase-associated DNA damage response exonuclease [Hyphomicrobiales bacterium]|nr:ligase-associated DNA damage response exonuclease [Hyphomicrobiales bacterium]MBV9115305.1 ligase-associated DNA damage response exonuclease [Hyphomicrobiales bacterium]